MSKMVGHAGMAALVMSLLVTPPANAATSSDSVTVDSGNGFYDSIVGFAANTPSWVRGFAEAFTKAGLLIFAVLFVIGWWRARRRGSARGVALALLAPIATGMAYLISELAKVFVHEDRPCRTLASSATIVECPDLGDWSLPSNHSTIAAAAAVGLILCWRKLLPWVVSVAVLMGFSRVFVGAHYPHDVLLGLALGAIVSALVAAAATGLVTGLVQRLARRSVLGRLLIANDVAATPPVPSQSAPPYDDQRTELMTRQPQRDEQDVSNSRAPTRQLPLPARQRAHDPRDYPNARPVPTEHGGSESSVTRRLDPRI